ncbi:MAG TPA: hypothetical protein VM163_10240 [bacterium]|nr:hypothetical protein [bacterium]
MNQRNDEKAVAYVDLLGFSNMVGESLEEGKRVLNDFYDVCECVIGAEPDVTGFLLSDSLVAYCDNKPLMLKVISKLYRECFKKNREYTDRNIFFLVPRGAIGVGLIEVREKCKPPNLTEGFVVSPALVHCVEMEKTVKGGRLLLAVKTDGEGKKKEETELLWSPENQGMIYWDFPLELWGGYRYLDLLWFSDSSKSRAQQKPEIEELIAVARDLVKHNTQNKEHLQKHCETLRIGLLSYSRFVEAFLRSELFMDLIREYEQGYEHEEFWPIWLGMVEMALFSPDGECALPYNQDFVGFCKKISLSRGWAKVLCEINKPGQEDVKRELTQVLEAMQIATM